MLSATSLDMARALIERKLGLDIREPELVRAVAELQVALRIADPDAALATLAATSRDTPTWHEFATRLTVRETRFFRDPSWIDALAEGVLRRLIDERRIKAAPVLRIWSAGCATGEEAYTLAILVERMIPNWRAHGVSILATDLNPQAIEVARLGTYRGSSLREVEPGLRNHYFREIAPDRFAVADHLREMIDFRVLNLATDAYPDQASGPSAFDLIVCRNVLMYFTADMQRRVVAQLCRCLSKRGWLATSPAESTAELFKPLVPRNFVNAIFFERTPAGSAERHRPIQPNEASRLSAEHFNACSDRHAGEARAAGQSAVAAAFSVPLAPAVKSKPISTAARAHKVDDEGLRHALTLLDQGQHEGAKRICEAMIEENRLSCDAHLLLTVIYAADGDTAGALAAVRRALYIAPSSVSAHLLNSTLLARLGKLDAAQRASTTASRLLAADVAAGSRASLPLEAALLSPFGSLEPREK